MDEIEEIPVETVAGARPRASTGDRLMVSLAALALLAGVLIAGANLLDALTEDAVAVSSPGQSDNPEPTARPSRTPRPSPSPRPLGEQTVVPGSPPPAFEGWQISTNGWLEVLQNVPVRSGPDASVEIGMLKAGDIVPAQTEPSLDGWLILSEPTEGGIQGWVQLENANAVEVARFYPIREVLRPGSIDRLLSGPRGYLALAWQPGRPSDFRPQILGSSPDGEHWTVSESGVVGDQGPFVAAWGPSGWIGASTANDGAGAIAWISESYDGSDWSALGSIRIGQSGWPQDLVGSELGYMMSVDTDGDGNVNGAWFSPDGVTWQETTHPLAGVRQRALDDGVQLLATPAGFLAWSAPQDGSTTEIAMAFSGNGRTWQAVRFDEPWVNGRLYIGQAGTGLVALARVGDRVHAWRSALGDSMHFVRAEGLEVAFDHALVANVVSNGSRAYAIGLERTSGEPRIWTSDGGSWRSVPPPDDGLSAGINVAAGVAAVGPAGLVVVGSQPTALGGNPVLLRLRADGTWASEAKPLIAPVPIPDAAECGPLPTTALEFVQLDPLWGPVCFEDAPMTFRAWSPHCDWCGGSEVPSGADSAWLFEAPGLALLPARSDYINGQQAVIHPSLKRQTDWFDAWLEVTGHYADPASEGCAELAALVGAEDNPYYYVWRERARDDCRQRFVVTAVDVVEGP